MHGDCTSVRNQIGSAVQSLGILISTGDRILGYYSHQPNVNHPYAVVTASAFYTGIGNSDLSRGPSGQHPQDVAATW